MAANKKTQRNSDAMTNVKEAVEQMTKTTVQKHQLTNKKAALLKTSTRVISLMTTKQSMKVTVTTKTIQIITHYLNKRMEIKLIMIQHAANNNNNSKRFSYTLVLRNTTVDHKIVLRRMMTTMRMTFMIHWSQLQIRKKVGLNMIESTTYITLEMVSAYQKISTTICSHIKESVLNGSTIYIGIRKEVFSVMIWDWVKLFRFAFI